jgi:hypothetical protein
MTKRAPVANLSLPDVSNTFGMGERSYSATVRPTKTMTRIGVTRKARARGLDYAHITGTPGDAKHSRDVKLAKSVR